MCQSECKKSQKKKKKKTSQCEYIGRNGFVQRTRQDMISLLAGNDNHLLCTELVVKSSFLRVSSV